MRPEIKMHETMKYHFVEDIVTMSVFACLSTLWVEEIDRLTWKIVFFFNRVRISTKRLIVLDTTIFMMSRIP